MNYQYSSSDNRYFEETPFKGQPLKGYKQHQQYIQQSNYEQDTQYQRKKNPRQFGSDQNKYRNTQNNQQKWKQEHNNYRQFPVFKNEDDYEQNQWGNLHDKSVISKNFEELERMHLKKDFLTINQVTNTYKFQTQFLRAKNYEDIQELRKYFSPLKYLNLGHFPKQNDVFVLIRPKAGHYNIHKAIKYGIWTSFTRQNKQLSQFYNDDSRNVYLIFLPLHSQNYRSKLIGIAQMISDYDEDRTFKFWDKDEVYIGSFQIIWHYVKNVDTNNIEPLYYYYKNQQCDIDDLKEGAQLHYYDALNIFQIFAETPDHPSVFNQFNGLDIQEDKQRYFKETGIYQQHQQPTTKKQYLY